MSRCLIRAVAVLSLSLGGCECEGPQQSMDEPFQVDVTPARELMRGENVTLQITIKALRTVVGDVLIGFDEEPGLEPPDGWTIVRRTLGAGESMTAVQALQLPDDVWHRRLVAFVRATDINGVPMSLERAWVMNPSGPMRAVNSTQTEFSSPLQIELASDVRIVPGTESELVVRIGSNVDLSMLRLALELPAELQRTSGPGEMVVGPQAAGATAEMRCRVRASSFAAPIVVIARGVSPEGHASAILEVAP